MNYEENNGVSQKTQSATRGSAVFITGSQLRDTTIDCDYLVITHQDFFSNPILADFVNYRATYGNLDVVVVQTSDIYAQFPSASGDDYSIKDFVHYAYDHWQTAPQYLLIVGNKQLIPSHQTLYNITGYPNQKMDDEKWYVCVAGSDSWADMAMGRFSVENEPELQSIYNKIVYYEQHQLSDKPFFKKALVIQGTCTSGEPVYDTVFNAGFNTTYISKFYYGTNQDIVTAINEGQDVVSYTGHGWVQGWEIFSIFDLPQLTNTIFPIVLTTACFTADLDYESLGEQFVNIENKGAVAYYGATNISSASPGDKILAAMFDNAEFHLGKAIMYGEFMWHPGFDWWHKLYILLGDPALQSFGYPENSNLPDLTVSSSGVNYDWYTKKLTVKVSNVGAVDADNVLVDVVIVDENAGTNILLGGHVFSVVPAGGAIQSVISGVAPPVKGDYSVVAIVDSENAIEESFELNNYNGKRMTVSPTFIDATSSSGISYYAYNKLVVPGDVNRDGYPDVYLTGSPGFLYLNDGDGTFTDITTAAGVRCANVFGAVFGDVDNDGNTDLYISSGNGDHLFRNRGDGTFENRTDVSGLGGLSSDETIFGDVNNDGYLDLCIVKQQPPKINLFINTGYGIFLDETTLRGLGVLNTGIYLKTPRFVDIDNDGDLDLIIEHYIEDSSPFTYYSNDGAGFFTPCLLNEFGCHSGALALWPGFSIADIDIDGDHDIIYLRNTGHTTFLINNGDGSFTPKLDLRDLRFGIYALFLAEVDNSPGEDILAIRDFPDTSQQPVLLRNSKTGLFKNYEYLPIIDLWHDEYLAPCVLDIDRDGDNDIIYGNYLGSSVKVLKNQINDQNWLDVEPVGRISNRDAVGAKVYIYSSQGELIGFQEVSSQRPVSLHFGLNGTEGPYDIVLQWPTSEITDVLQHVSPAQLMTVTEGSTLSSLFVNAGRPYAAILGDPIHFRGIALGEEPYTWYWDFGDDSSSDLQNPYHNYTQAGVYTVTLTVTDSLGRIANDTTTATITPLIADAHGPYAGFAGQSIDFCGSATGGIQPYTYCWDFGDNTPIATQQNPYHTYSAAGTYPVTLTATDALGHSNSTRTTAVICLPPIHNLNKGTYYLTIQEAIDEAAIGDTICVRNGTYYENIFIWRPLTLIGENKETTIIDGDCGEYSWETVGLYECSDIVIHQFTIKNGHHGIMLYDTNHITISDCIITDATDFGIWFYSTQNTNNTISQNLITRCDYGIYLSDGWSQNNIYENTIKDNRITGIKIQGSAAPTNNNRLYHNTFINNTQNAYDICNNIWYNATTQEGNYWDDYTGSDANDDGIGDTPYNISGGSNQDLYPLMKPWVLIPGDLNHDGDVDDDDFTIFEASYGLSYGDPHYNIRADYDGDNNITLADYVIWLGYYRSFLQLPGDLDHDNDVDQDDFALFLQTFGHSIVDPLFNPEADYNNNGVVDLVDYQIWLMYYRDFVTSHTDILISGISANYTSSASTSFSAEHDTATKIKFTAIIKNNGTLDITTPFQVSFYGYIGPYDPQTRPIHLGTVEISSLFVGETTEATLLWRLQPEIQTVLVFADSSRVIKEADESNNEMSIKLPSYPLWSSLTQTQEDFKKLNEQYKVPSAEKIITLAEEDVSSETYTNPQTYVETMKGIAGLEFQVGDELKGQVHDDQLQKYQDAVKQLIVLTDSFTHEVSWEDAERVAEIQLQICELVDLMIR
ncbi:MAG: C25 family cysteine peptidase [Euryarchaeota archaeon]|nr:C25 family cysteine peptidase [Euryarchaeota archaeon]